MKSGRARERRRSAVEVAIVVVSTATHGACYGTRMQDAASEAHQGDETYDPETQLAPAIAALPKPQALGAIFWSPTISLVHVPVKVAAARRLHEAAELAVPFTCEHVEAVGLVWAFEGDVHAADFEIAAAGQLGAAIADQLGQRLSSLSAERTIYQVTVRHVRGEVARIALLVA